jgi:hypothetical protein
MTPPRPTVFISYASEDRAAAALLRDALATHGLDVWFDENELGGGDVWDQKIRRQIRECDYFMPVISATTERRKEGYFRREWRLAAERTLDMADDVMFLLPITIDDTSEYGARVPEKFAMVQWLSVRGGVATPALEALAQRLAAGDHAVPPKLESRPPLLGRAAPKATSEPAHEGPPPMPPFPHMQEGHRVKFVAEVLWWVITAAWLLLRRAPGWVRIAISVWFVLWVISTCSRGGSRTDFPREKPQASATDNAEARKAIQETAAQLAALGKPADGAAPGAGNKFADIGSQIAGKIAAELKEKDPTEFELVAVPFAPRVTEEENAKFMNAVFTALYGQLAVAQVGKTALAPEPLPAVTPEALVAVGERVDARYVLGAQLAPGDISIVVVQLLRTDDASVAWTAQYPITGGNPASVANEIAKGVLATLEK